jgi:putative PIN family toxin of toxin-antitoxin system
LRLLLDSNVIIAAFAARGLCHALFEYCLESHEVLMCEEILDEIREKLITKVKVPASLASDIEKYIGDSTELVSPQTLLVPELKDNRDLPVLGAAVASGAAYLITGDAALLELRKIKKTIIVSPRAFWEAMKGG